MATGQASGQSYHHYVPDLTLPRFTTMQTQDATEYAQAFKTKAQPPWLHGLYQHWCKLYEEPFRGITTDGESYENSFLRHY